MKLLGIVFLFLNIFCANASAALVPIGENERWAAYGYTDNMQKSGQMAKVWVLFDYKSIQTSPLSGRRYSSEKSQREIDCQKGQLRTVFGTWHSDRMGGGIIVYTGRNSTEWEPASPYSIAVNIIKFACEK